MNIVKGDIDFIKKTLIPWVGIRRIYLAESKSRAKYPDIWLTYKDGVPVITVTREWRGHVKDLRRSQLVHEGLHVLGLNHGRVGRYDYNTHPELDTYSKYVYRGLI